MIPKNFRTRPTGSCVAHSPEIVLVSEAGNSVGVETYLVDPDAFSFIITIMNRNPQAFRRKLNHLGEEFPGKTNGLFLEVIAKTEITQHFKKRMVTSCIANIIKVVMLAARTKTTLTRCCPGISSIFPECERFLELHHARIGEEQGGIVARYQGCGINDGVTLTREEVEESGP